MSKDNTLFIAGGAVAAYFLLIKPAMAAGGSAGSNLLSSIIPGSAAAATPGSLTNYPYLVTGAPLPLPTTYSPSYYISYIYPAMVQQDPNVSNPGYTLSQEDANDYLANYVDLQQWVQSFKTGTQLQHLQFHWKTYGVPEQRTFLPLPWTNPQQWVPPPAKQSGGVFSDVLKGLTVVGAGVAIVASGGTLAPIVEPAAGVALNAESSIHGTLPELSYDEWKLLFSGAAILKNILPFYNQSDKKVVKLINNKLTSLLNSYSG